MNVELMRLRLPANVKAWLRTRAENSDRSMNAELLQLLKSAMRAEKTASAK